MAFVISAGQLQAVDRPAPVASYALQISDDVTRDYAQLWRAQPELRTVVDFLARNIAQLGIHVFRRVSDVDRQRLADHPLAQILARPNHTTTRYRLVDTLVHDLCIYDLGVWLKMQSADGEPIGLRRIPPNRITPTGTDWLDATAYDIRGSKGKLTVPASSVVVFRGYNPTDSRTGASPIESLRQILAEEYAANTYREQLWRNGARMSGYIKRPVEAPDWGSRGRERFRSEWQTQYTGAGERAGATPILEDGMDWVAAATSPRDAQYVESRKLTREEVARSYHVPLPMVGILDHATFSNIREQHKQLYQDCLGPWLEMISQDIELQLLPDLADTTGVYVEFNINEKLRGSFEEQAAQLQQSVGGPYMTRNEARARLNLPQVDGGDDLIVPLNVSIGGASGANEPDDAQAARNLVEMIQKVYLGVGKVLSVDEARQLLNRAGGGFTLPTPDDVVAQPPAPVGAGKGGTAQHAAVLGRHFARQGRVVLAALGADRAKHAEIRLTADELVDARWDDELAVDLFRSNPAAGTTAADTAREANAAVRRDVAAALAGGGDQIAAVKRLYDNYAAGRVAPPAASQTGR